MKSTSIANRRVGIVRGLVALLACGAAAACTPTTQITGAFSQAEAPRSGDVLAAIENPAERDDEAVVAGVTEDGKLFLWAFEGGLRWQREINAGSAPLLAGSLVVTQEGERVVARSTIDGVERFAIDEPGARLVGADATADLAVVAIQLQDDDGGQRGLIVAARHGEIVWETELPRPVGTPAVVDKYVVVPWGTLHVSLLHALDGTEAQRVDLRDSVAGHAFVDRGNVYVGQHGLLRVERSLEAGKRGSALYYSPVARPLPGQPGLLRDAYEPVPAPSHAGHRVRLDFRIKADKDGLRLEDSQLYMHFYSFIFALDDQQDAVRWLYHGDDDVVGTTVVPGGLYMADTAGELAFINSLGHVTWRTELGVHPTVVTIRSSGLAPVDTAEAGRAPDDKAKATTTTGASFRARPLQEQLYDAARLDDPRLGGGRAFAINHLARFDGARVTEYLLSLCDNPGAPDLVRIPACRGLGERKQGKRAIMATLKRRASHRERIPPPPVAALAKAASTMGLKKAGPLLLAHLSDPHTPTRDLGPTMDALGELKHRAAARTIEEFVRMHHAEPKEANMRRALIAGLGALVKLKGKGSSDLLKEISSDALSMPAAAAHATHLLRQLRAPKQKQQAAKPKTRKTADKKPPAAEKPTIRYLSMGVVARVLRPSDRKLLRCLRQDNSGAAGARISMVVRGDGRIERSFVTPAAIQQCVERVLAKVTFPASQQGRQQVVHVVKSRETRRAQRAADRRRKRASRVKLTEK